MDWSDIIKTKREPWFENSKQIHFAPQPRVCFPGENKHFFKSPWELSLFLSGKTEEEYLEACNRQNIEAAQFWAKRGRQEKADEHMALIDAKGRT